MGRKSLTLVEVMVSILIVALGVGAIFLIYPTLFEGVNVTSEKVRVWEVAQRQMEILRNSTFASLFAVAYDPSAEAPIVNAFATGVANSSGVYYVEKMYGDANNDGFDEVLTDLVRIEVVICFTMGNRVIGEDANLNGILDAGEDQDGDGKISSPITLGTLVMSSS